jgi:hypothetical protein
VQVFPGDVSRRSPPHSLAGHNLFPQRRHLCLLDASTGNQFAIGAGKRALPRALDALLELGEPVAIVLGPHGSIWVFVIRLVAALMIALGREIIVGPPTIDKSELT